MMRIIVQPAIQRIMAAEWPPVCTGATPLVRGGLVRGGCGNFSIKFICSAFLLTPFGHHSDVETLASGYDDSPRGRERAKLYQGGTSLLLRAILKWHPVI